MPISREAVAVQAFLATPAAMTILQLTPLDVLPIARILRADGVLLAKTAPALHAEMQSYLLGLAAEHGDRWKYVLIRTVTAVTRQDPVRRIHLARGRDHANALVGQQNLKAALEAMMETLATCPGGVPRNIQVVLRIQGEEAMRQGPVALTQWIEVFR